MGPVDGELLGHVVGVGAGEPGPADEDQGLGRQVDVLLVLGGVAGDGLVAELRQLDSDLGRRHPVGAVPDDGPVAPAGCVELGRLGDLPAPGNDPLHGVGKLAQALQEVRRPGRVGARGLGQGD